MIHIDKETKADIKKVFGSRCDIVEHFKGIIILDMLEALFFNERIKDKEQFIADFYELIDEIKNIKERG